MFLDAVGQVGRVSHLGFMGRIKRGCDRTFSPQYAYGQIPWHSCLCRRLPTLQVLHEDKTFNTPVVLFADVLQSPHGLILVPHARANC
jgi:hypothetical protein